MIGLLATAFASPCEAPSTIVALSRAQTRASAAFRSAQQAELESAVAEATTLLPCLGEQLTTSDLGAFYRTVALSTFVARDRSATLRWFAASRAAEPQFSFSDARMAASHPFRRLYDGTEAEPETVVPVEGIVGWIRVDGRRTEALPTTRAYVVQQFSPEGKVLQTALVAPGESPDLVLEPEAVPEPPPEVPVAPEPTRSVDVPTPSETSARPMVLAAGIGAAWMQGPTSLYLRLEPHLRVPLGSVFDLDVAAPLAWTRGEQFYVVPMVRAGLTWSPGRGRTRPWLGVAAAVGFYNPKGPLKTPVMPGAVALIGLDHDLGRMHFVVDGMGGWVGRPTVSATVGLGLEL